MHLKNPTDLFTALRPFYVIYKVLGLAPFSYSTSKPDDKKETATRLQTTTASFLYSIFICFLIFLMYVFYFVTRGFQIMKPQYNVGEVVSEILSTTVLYVTGFFCVVIVTKNRRRVVNVFESIVDADLVLMQCPKSVYKSTERKASLLYFIVAINLVSFVVVDYIIQLFVFLPESNSWSPVRITLTLFQFIAFVFIYLFNLQFGNTLFLLRERFTLVNEELHLFLNKQREQRKDKKGHVSHFKEITASEEPQDKSSSNSMIESLKVINFQLFQLSYEVNDIYGFGVLLSLVCIFINIIHNLYLSVLNVLSGNYTSYHLAGVETDAYFKAFLKFIWTVQYLLIALNLKHMAASTRKSYNRAAMSIQEILLHKNKMEVEIFQEWERFLSQVTNMTLRFTACGFFELDYGVLVAMGGAVTTYLVILLQSGTDKNTPMQFFSPGSYIDHSVDHNSSQISDSHNKSLYSAADNISYSSILGWDDEAVGPQEIMQDLVNLRDFVQRIADKF